MNKKTLAVLSAAGLGIFACSDPSRTPTAILAPTDPANAVSTNPGNGSQLHGAPEHLFYARGQNARKQTSVNMTWHGGTILVANKTQAIFWGTSWTSYTGDIISGLDSFFGGFGGSNYANASTEYTGSNGQVTAASTYLGHVVDATSAPSRALSVTSAVAEACKMSNNAPDPNALYLIYTETGAGHVNYCAWHSYGTCSNGAPVQVAYMPNITGIAGCDPQDTYGTGHSQGLAALANVTAHELSETITDPRNGGWWDSGGAENGDKCAWAFLAPVTLTNRSVWKLQGEWSNNAYTAGTGYPNNSGQKGCLQG
ncbi:MAG: hypothetical protein ABI408_13745 [Gemmatimonadaceae bacterium]